MTVKRLFDILVSGPALLVFAPLLAIVAIAVRMSMGAPVLFRQRRPGLMGKPFEMVKFRTMRDVVDATGRRLPDTQRITRLGALLRASSLDELPELWNVLKGDMSLVGPRPLLMDYLPLYSPAQARRHDVRPGITGWAQVNGRNAISWDEKFALDIWYVDNQRFSVDVAILGRTVLTLFKRYGVDASADETMPRFVGSPPATGTGGMEGQ